MLYLARALALGHPLLLAAPFALLAAVGAYFGAMNAAVRHAVLPHTSPLARAEPGTHTALARQIVRRPAPVAPGPLHSIRHHRCTAVCTVPGGCARVRAAVKACPQYADALLRTNCTHARAVLGCSWWVV